MPTLPAIRNQFNDLPEEVQSHLRGLPPLLAGKSLQAALAFLFMMIEQGRYRAIKCGLVRILKCNTAIIDNLLEKYEFSRKSFRLTVKNLMKIDTSGNGMRVLENAEAVRDKALHGRKPSDADLRQAISDGLTFVSVFGEEVASVSGKNPFGDLRGLTSRIKTLDKKQSNWIVRGVLSAAERNEEVAD